jgi:hypothetical protein
MAAMGPRTISEERLQRHRQRAPASNAAQLAVLALVFVLEVELEHVLVLLYVLEVELALVLVTRFGTDRGFASKQGPLTAF